MAHDSGSFPILREPDAHPRESRQELEPKLPEPGRVQLRHDNHTTSTVVMITPALFRHNFDTARDNSYQKKPDDMTTKEVEALANLPRAQAFAQHSDLQARTERMDAETHTKALAEFKTMVGTLRSKTIRVIEIPDVLEHDTPDSVFPNNPISTHPEMNGTAVKFPMRNRSRRPEKQLPIVETLSSVGYRVGRVVDLSTLEEEGHFVEGTGSMVLDRTNKIAYASLSQRTTKQGVERFGQELGYRTITFTSHDRIRETDVYHANVVMSVGNGFAVICSEAITDAAERETVIASLRETGKDIIEITAEQMNGFAGNILEVRNELSQPVIVMSKTAYDTFDRDQLARLSRYGEIVACPIPTIEEHGGGSARCMLLEIHLPKEEVH